MPRGSRGRVITFQGGAGAAGSAARPSDLEAFARALEALTRIAYEAESVPVGLAGALDAICTAMGWPVGHVYHLADAEGRVLISADLWHLEAPERFAAFQEASVLTTFRPGRGLVGQVMAQGRPRVSPDVTRDRRFLRRHAAEATGVRAWFAFPVFADERVVAVCEFFTTERVALDPALAGLLSGAGLALGRLYERDRWRAERELLLSRLSSRAPGHADERQALSAMAGALAHELNSPLFSARAGLALLAAERPDDPLVAGARDDLARIAAVLETLHDLAQEAPIGQRLAQIVGPPTA